MINTLILKFLKIETNLKKKSKKLVKQSCKFSTKRKKSLLYEKYSQKSIPQSEVIEQLILNKSKALIC